MDIYNVYHKLVLSLALF